MLKNLRILRKQRGLSQQQLANALGISQQSVHKYESTNTEPDISTMITIADYFNTTIDYLTGRTNEDVQNILDYKAAEIRSFEMREEPMDANDVRAFLLKAYVHNELSKTLDTIDKKMDIFCGIKEQ